jgi:signal transduction histidine kinase/ligand-binding sensor domain-containing protein
MRHRRGSGIPPSAWRAYLGLALLAVLGVTPAGAAEPVVRRIHEPEALAAFPVWAIAQDAQGFLWLGTQGRLYRWDGLVLQRHAAASLPDTPWELRVSPDGVLHLRTRERGDLLRLAVGEVEPVTGPRGAPLTGLTAFAWDSGGALWVTGRGGLWRYGTNESWREVIDPRISGGRARRLRPAADNAMLVATRTEVYRVATGGDVRQLAKLPSDVHGGLVDLLELPDGRLALLPFWGGIYLAEGGEVRHVVVRRDRGIALVLRGDTLWASFAASVVGLRPDGSVEIVGEDEGVTSGGPMLLDREGSLWVGSFNGLTQLPEPDTVIWKRGDGLPTLHTRFLTVAGNSVWVSTWAGTLAFVEAKGEYRLEPSPEALRQSVGRDCREPTGDVLVGTSGGLLRRRGGGWDEVLPKDLSLVSCSPEEEATWLLTTQHLLRVAAAAPGDRAVGGPYPLPRKQEWWVLLRDSGRRLWLGGVDGVICSGSSSDVLAGAEDAWSCETLPGAGRIADLEELADGTLWAGSEFGGLLERRGSTWVRLEQDSESRLPQITGIDPSPRGGVWLAGSSRLMRVRRDPPAANGYRVLEELSGWHGLPSPGGQEIAEDRLGTLWVTTNVGVIQVSPEVRERQPAPPPVVLVEVLVDDEPLAGLAPLELPFDRNRIELRFAALSFRHPELIRYQVRLGPEAPWRNAGPSGRFRWVDLAPGAYLAAVRASLDSESWTPEPASLSFRVLPPWYGSVWARAFFAALLVGALTAAYRLRVAHLVALERQRARIATDLHDELGSGLGSIGVLAELMGSPGSPGGDPEDRELAQQIAGTAHELGTALTDIVWALHSRSGTLQEVFARLAERARGLLAGAATELSVRPPASWPDGNLTAEVRRNVLLVGLEALHNAARHSGARSIELGLAPEDGSWRLTVRDDGQGMPEESELRPGHGVPGMRRRAAEIGGEVCWLPTPGGGTTTTLLFHRRGARRP